MPTLKVPAGAFRFDSGICRFDAAQPTQQADPPADPPKEEKPAEDPPADPPKEEDPPAEDPENTEEGFTAPISLMARSGQPAYHWFWGACVHDMAGFTPAKPKLALDYRHDDGEPIGFLDTFNASPAGLACSGQLVSTDDDDRAAEVYKKGKAGVPYESSVFFDPAGVVVEEVGPGMTADVNGVTVTGPMTIFRKWSLRGVAVCLYGTDSNTPVQFAADASKEVEITLDKIPSRLAASKPVADRASFAADLKRYTDKFGAINGTKWFTEGKTFEQALELHAAELKTQLTAKEAEVATLNTKLANAPRGEREPVSLTPGDPAPSDQTSQLSQKEGALLGPNLSRYAASLKLPS